MYWTKHVGGALSIYALHAEIPEALETCPLFLLKLHCVSMIKLCGHRREFNPKPLGPSQKLKGMTDDQTLESCLGLSWVFNPAKCINYPSAH